MANKVSPTQTERLFNRIKNNKLIALLIVLGVAVISLATLTDAVSTIRSLFTVSGDVASGAVQVSSIDISPSEVSLTVGDDIQLKALPRSVTGASIPGKTVTWNSTKAAVVTVSQQGIATAVGKGKARIVASVGSVSGSSSIAVSDAPISTIVIEPSTTNLEIGESQHLKCVLRDNRGNILSNRPITWTSSNPEVARVSRQGILTASGVGTTLITAMSGDASAQLRLAVAQVRIVSIQVHMEMSTIKVGETSRAHAEALNKNGQRIVEPLLSWRSANPEIASVSSGGELKGRAPGRTWIIASSGEVSERVEIVVSPEALQSQDPYWTRFWSNVIRFKGYTSDNFYEIKGAPDKDMDSWTLRGVLMSPYHSTDMFPGSEKTFVMYGNGQGMCGVIMKSSTKPATAFTEYKRLRDGIRRTLPQGWVAKDEMKYDDYLWKRLVQVVDSGGHGFTVSYGELGNKYEAQIRFFAP